MIWYCIANHPRTIAIRDVDPSEFKLIDRFVKHNATAIPGGLHANKEAHAVARRHYKPILGSHFRGNPIFFNY
jgi:hypothetical protein